MYIDVGGIRERNLGLRDNVQPTCLHDRSDVDAGQ